MRGGRKDKRCDSFACRCRWICPGVVCRRLAAQRLWYAMRCGGIKSRMRYIAARRSSVGDDARQATRIAGVVRRKTFIC